MKKDTHPKYQEVLFIDSSTGTKFVCGTTLQSEETKKHEGVEYPVYRIPVSSASHPFFTGKMQFVDTAGRIDKFNKKFGKSRFAKTLGDKTPEETTEA